MVPTKENGGEKKREEEAQKENEEEEVEEEEKEKLWFPKFCTCGNITMNISLVVSYKAHSSTKKEKPKGMKLTARWFEEERLNKMYVFLGGKMRLLLSTVNQCDL